MYNSCTPFGSWSEPLAACSSPPFSGISGHGTNVPSFLVVAPCFSSLVKSGACLLGTFRAGRMAIWTGGTGFRAGDGSISSVGIECIVD